MSTREMDAAFEAVCSGLPSAGIDFLMVGGHAVNHYGYTRATQDIDFMITVDDSHKVREVMEEAGFSNMSSQDLVMFFNLPGTSLRIDFLKVDEKTMALLKKNSEEVEYFGGRRIKVPQLKDLIAMKLFALRTGSADRRDRDFPDIIQLAIINRLDVNRDLKPLCDKYGTPELFEALQQRIEELKNA